MAFRYRSWGWRLAIALATTGATASTHAQEPERKPERHRLRLDEAPELVLLETFRHAHEPRRRAIVQWRQSVWGRWIRHNLYGLDWEAAGEPTSPNVGVGTSRWWYARLGEVEARWPFAQPRHSWFERGTSVTWLVDPVEADPEVVPPWLARVDVHWAHAIVHTAGCGRGGACSIGEPFPGDAFMALHDALSPETLPPGWWECRERPLRVHRLGREQGAVVRRPVGWVLGGQEISDDVLLLGAREDRRRRRPTEL